MWQLTPVSLTPVPGCVVTSSDLHLHQTCTYYTHTYVVKPATHIKLKALFLLNERERKAATSCQTVMNIAHGSQTVPPQAPHLTGHIYKRNVERKALSDASPCPGSPKPCFSFGGPHFLLRTPLLKNDAKRKEIDNVENQEVYSSVLGGGTLCRQ